MCGCVWVCKRRVQVKHSSHKRFKATPLTLLVVSGVRVCACFCVLHEKVLQKECGGEESCVCEIGTVCVCVCRDEWSIEGRMCVWGKCHGSGAVTALFYVFVWLSVIPCIMPKPGQLTQLYSLCLCVMNMHSEALGLGLLSLSLGLSLSHPARFLLSSRLLQLYCPSCLECWNVISCFNAAEEMQWLWAPVLNSDLYPLITGLFWTRAYNDWQDWGTELFKDMMGWERWKFRHMWRHKTPQTLLRVQERKGHTAFRGRLKTILIGRG